MGAMPVYPPLKISDAQLVEIISYIQSLEDAEGHAAIEDPEFALFQHHWMALLALEDGSVDDAVHHIDHIIEVVTGHHLSQMTKVKGQIEAGDLHEGVHAIRAMLTGNEGHGLTSLETNGGLARSSVEIGDVEEAVQHLKHSMENLSNGSLVARVEGIIGLLGSGELPDAPMELEELIRN